MSRKWLFSQLTFSGVCFWVLLTMFPLSAIGEDDFQLGQKSWTEGRYLDAYTHLIRYREELYGRRAHVDYMLGTSGCRVTELRIWGGDVLEWMLYRYALSEPANILIRKELNLCRATDPDPLPENNLAGSVEIIASLIGASSRASGKTYYWVGRDETFNTYPAYRVAEIPKEEMEARLIPLGNPDLAAEATQARVKKFTVVPFERFIFASHSGQSPETLNKMASYLEKYLDFLEQQYGISLPGSYVTVYMVPYSEELVDLALELHGLKVSRATFGYSFRDDMSVLVAIPDGFQIGTIMHEFFHLAIRSHFGDAPQWLDEGMASLYEVAKFDGNSVIGLPNWRGKVLIELMRRNRDIRPTIKQVVTSNWFAFEQYELAKDLQHETDDESPPAEQMATMLATARYFTLYLQENGKLKAIYQDLQQLTPGGRPMPPAKESVAIIEKHMGQSIDTIDAEFMAWFKKIEHIE
ncbi:hypothetical protein [Desulfopila aestuarii]|uniref:DUF1570 domain-containing protein n=1 Tax=Desulfopila aestuarii DSM 18488 TaxID=1121416 RepID=A0A1M7Y5N5_9BACT|nr:hypothetical protein [Desulfopila aestuarii]SHO47838.1 hypothetical protein SAMN02745220_01988 [Desulfopila aestuarii DSM 18488]